MALPLRAIRTKELIYSNTGIAGIELRSSDGFVFPGSRAQVLARLLSAVALKRNQPSPSIGTMSVLKAAQNANTAFSEIPIMSARSIHT